MGTTISILQAYPLGTLEVAYAAAPHMGIIGHIAMLAANTPGGDEAYVKTDERGISSHWAPVAKFLPVLRPFADLCTPLEDGTVPASVIAEGWDMGTGILFLYNLEGELEYEAHEDGLFCTMYYEGPRQRFTESQSWPSGIVEKLRAMHFALPVNGKLLVEGTDYIRKEA